MTTWGETKLPPTAFSGLAFQAEIQRPEAEIEQPEAEIERPKESGTNPAPACLRPEAEMLRAEAGIFRAQKSNSGLPPAWQLRPGLKQLPTWTQAAAWR